MSFTSDSNSSFVGLTELHTAAVLNGRGGGGRMKGGGGGGRGAAIAVIKCLADAVIFLKANRSKPKTPVDP